MPKQNAPITSFSHGEVSKLATARVDITRLKFAAEAQVNYMPRTVGPMTFRPGLEKIGTTKNDAVMMPIPFVFSVDDQDTAVIEMTAGAMRFRVGDELVTREEVEATITNGSFATDLTGWTEDSIGVANAESILGNLHMVAQGIGDWITLTQAVAIGAGEDTIEHGLRISILQGPVRLRVGTTSGGDDLITSTLLGVGEHALTFTPGTAIVYVQLEGRERYSVIVENIAIDAAGTLELSTPFTLADLPLLRWTQSADVIYLASGKHPYKIERRGTTSWSFVKFQPEDGPFKPLATADVKINPSDLASNIELSSDVPFFSESMVGSLIRLTHDGGQAQNSALSDDDTFTDPIRVSGVHNPDNFAAGGRLFTVHIDGTFVGTLSLMRSFDGPDSGFEVLEEFTGADTGQTFAIVDEFDNSIAWYKIGFQATEYTSGTAIVQLAYPAGAGSGVARITVFTSSTLVSGYVIKEFVNTVPTKIWQLGEWNDKYGFPSAVELFEGRLWWFGQDRYWGSVSDAYESYDVTFEGDAGSIQRSIGYGPVENISWALPLQRLITGTGFSEISARSSSFDEPLTPTNFGLRDASTQGSTRVAAVKVDGRGIFITRSKRRAYQLLFSVENGDYSSNDLTALLPDLPSDFVKVVVQRHPDTRIHFVMANGTAKVLLFEPSEEVVAWYTVETDGEIESAVVLPETIEDRVYYVVKRTINGETKRFVEKFALISTCTGQAESRLADCHTVFNGLTSATLTGLDYLEGEEVVVWAWDDDDTTGTDFSELGEDPPTYTVTDGEITIPEIKDNAVVGLPYEARFKSAKLAYAAAAGTALTQKKIIDHIGLILLNTHAQGIKFGQSFTKMDDLPQMHECAVVDADHVYEELDQPAVNSPGTWDTDARLHLKSLAPRPCTVLGAVITITTHDKL